MISKHKRAKKGYMKATILTEDGRAEREGPLGSTIADLILFVRSRDVREKILERIQENHRVMCEQEERLPALAAEDSPDPEEPRRVNYGGTGYDNEDILRELRD